MAGENIKADAVLANNSWATIGKVARKGMAKQYWKIGDEKTFYEGGKLLTAVIIGFDHDDVAEPAVYGREKAGITFQIKEIDFTSRYNENDKETSGWLEVWKNSFLRTNTLQSHFANVEEDLRNEVVAVNKICSCGRSSNDTELVADEVFVLSEQEVFGTKTHSKIEEGSQYEYYSAGKSKAKSNEDGSVKEWWTRSLAKVYVSGAGFVCTGQYKVNIKNDGRSDYSKGYTFSVGVSFAFCV